MHKRYDLFINTQFFDEHESNLQIPQAIKIVQNNDTHEFQEEDSHIRQLLSHGNAETLRAALKIQRIFNNFMYGQFIRAWSHLLNTCSPSRIIESKTRIKGQVQRDMQKVRTQYVHQQLDLQSYKKLNLNNELASRLRLHSQSAQNKSIHLEHLPRMNQHLNSNQYSTANLHQYGSNLNNLNTQYSTNNLRTNLLGNNNTSDNLNRQYGYLNSNGVNLNLNKYSNNLGNCGCHNLQYLNHINLIQGASHSVDVNGIKNRLKVHESHESKTSYQRARVLREIAQKLKYMQGTRHQVMDHNESVNKLLLEGKINRLEHVIQHYIHQNQRPQPVKNVKVEEKDDGLYLKINEELRNIKREIEGLKVENNQVIQTELHRRESFRPIQVPVSIPAPAPIIRQAPRTRIIHVTPVQNLQQLGHNGLVRVNQHHTVHNGLVRVNDYDSGRYQGHLSATKVNSAGFQGYSTARLNSTLHHNNAHGNLHDARVSSAYMHNRDVDMNAGRDQVSSTYVDRNRTNSAYYQGASKDYGLQETRAYQYRNRLINREQDICC